ncbi:hypothetical protein [Micromonospora sp. NPDC005806]|uniref:hypothetical protein n=1 Tax=Micromonospora sp. NPDC005806 TaxID=3364234 RepID=UPI0036884258
MGTGGPAPSGRSGLSAPEWSGALAGHWPALPDEDRAVPADQRRHDPWPALPDDRELWVPAAGVPDAAHLRRLDREQRGG